MSTPPSMCPGCRALVPPDTSPCPYCGHDLALARIRRGGGWLQRLLRGPGGVTRALIAFNLLLAVGTAFATAALGRAAAMRQTSGELLLDGVLSPPGGILTLLGAAVPRLMAEGEYWRFAAAVFLHGGILHIAMNMMALRQVGPAVEEAWGAGKMLAVYLLCGIAGTAARLAWVGGSGPGAEVPSIGASGAIVGLFGVLAAIGFRIGGEAGKRLWRQMLEPVAFILILGIVLAWRGSSIRLDNAAHAGGFLFGLVAGFLTPFGARARASATVVRAWDAAAVVLSLAFAASLVPGVLEVLRLTR